MFGAFAHSAATTIGRWCVLTYPVIGVSRQDRIPERGASI